MSHGGDLVRSRLVSLAWRSEVTALQAASQSYPRYVTEDPTITRSVRAA
jgi:hypothetical protein